MKRFIISLISCTTLFMGCTEVTDGLDRAEVLSVSVDSIDMDAEGGDVDVVINSVCRWNIDYNSLEWVSASIDEGRAGNKGLKIKLSENPYPEERSGIIIVRTNYDEIYHEIPVKQGASEPYITLEANDLTAEVEGTTFNLSVASNVEWTATCDAAWVAVTPNTGDDKTSTIEVVVAENIDTESRNATIIVENNTYKVKQAITISQSAFEPNITVSKDSVMVGSDATSVEITIDSKIEWTATCDADWVTVTPDSGEVGTTTLKLDIAKNKALDKRSSVVKIANDYYNFVREISVSQGTSAPYIELSQKSLAIGAESETLTIEVNSNIAWTATCDAEWVAVSPANGNAGTTALKVDVTQNKELETRTATIKVKGKEYDIMLEVTLSQSASDVFIDLAEEALTIDSEGGVLTVEVNSNIAWTTSCNAKWVSVNPANGNTGTTTLKLTIAQNEEVETRAATIKVKGKEYDIVREITVSQGADNVYINLAKESFSIDSRGGILTVEVNSNIAWTATCDAEWMSATPTNGSAGTTVLRLNVVQNKDVETRTAIVKIAGNSYDAIREITVSQDAIVPYITISKESYDFTSNGGKVTTTINSNVEWTATCDADWVTYSKVGNTLSITVSECSGAARSCNVVISSEEYNISKSITINQIGNYYILEYTSSQKINFLENSEWDWGWTSFEDDTTGHVWENGYGEVHLKLTTTTIPDYAFWGSNVTSVTIPHGITTLGSGIFSDCESLTSVTIPSSVTLIGDSAFSGCSSLTSMTIPEGVKTIYSSTFASCSSLESITIPSSVTEIGISAFSGCSSLTSVTIPSSVTLIGDSAFSGCSSLTSMTIPNSVTSIGSSAFSGCSSLTSMTIPEGVKTIYSSTFASCSSLESITIPSSVTSIGYSAFSDCSSLTSMTIPNSVTTIGASAFSRCSSLTSMTIPNSVTSIGSSAFSDCSSLSKFYGKFASDDNRCLIIDGELHSFAPSGVTLYTIPNSVTTIGASAFSRCSSLTSVTIPSSVTEIGASAFSGCSSLTSVTIPSSVTSIGYSAFSGCSSLTSVYCKPTTPPTCGWGSFNNNASGRKIYVPTASVEAYKSANLWKNYADDIEGYKF